jgi:hypothetical protein
MNWLKSMLSDSVDGSVSSKRVITLLSFLLIAAGAIGDLLYDLKIDNPTINNLMYIVVAGLGFTASEKFAPK